ncbi:hypothetical protein GY45DRAFT_472428 [Cubamyces sp. BRFM 1775]|nr:hypothetical protein GY45DRAFT_472428 [Cubamyces sp. BRFM 1775]
MAWLLRTNVLISCTMSTSASGAVHSSGHQILSLTKWCSRGPWIAASFVKWYMLTTCADHPRALVIGSEPTSP